MKAHKLFGKDKKQDDQTALDTLSEEVRNFNFREKKYMFYVKSLY